DAKSWVLRQVISTGVLNTSIKKEAPIKQQAGTDFSFSSHDGNINNISMLRGKVVFINFWASWCPPCRAEMPSINDLYKKLQSDTNFVFLSINEDDDKSKANAYLENNDFSFPIFYASGNVPGEIFAGTLPTTIVLSKQGRIVLKHEGSAGYNTDSL